MSLTPNRAVAYTFGALTGAFGALAASANRDGNRIAAGAALVGALCCGALAVAFEERAQATADGRPRPAADER